jgi:hypothetical protein
VQGYIFGRPADAETTRQLANSATVEADGFQCIREPRHRLMRRAITSIDDELVEIRLRNISSKGALADCSIPVTEGAELTVDIVGVGPVRAIVRWVQAGQFGVQFKDGFDMSRLAPRKDSRNDVTMMTPWYVDRLRAAKR